MAINGFARLVSHVIVAQPEPKTRTKAESEPLQVMVQCPTCNLYVLRNFAVAYRGKLFCCAEHVRSS